MATLLQHLRQESRAVISSAYAGSTNKNLKTQIKSFLLFTLYCNIASLPASTETAVLYVIFLKHSGLSYATIKNYLNGVRIFHLCHGFSFDVLQQFDMRLVLQGIKREIGNAPRPKLAIQPETLALMAQHVNYNDTFELAAWTAILIGFFGFLRKSNLVPQSKQGFNNHRHLSRSNVHRITEGLRITLRSTKTIQYRQRDLTLYIAHIPGSILDPVAAWDRLVANTANADSQGPSFVFHTANGYTTLTHSTLVKYIKSLVYKVGLDPTQYSGHSLRRGGCTFAFQAGVPVDLIRQHGDWKSNAYQQYLEFNSASRLTVTRAMGSQLTGASLATLAN